MAVASLGNFPVRVAPIVGLAARVEGSIVLDGKLYSAPTVREEISGGNAQISGGNMTDREAINLANVLNNPLDSKLEIKEQFATPRRTEILDNEFEQDIEDLIQREDMVVTVTHGGYVKRVPVSAYRAQRRGGKGRSGMATREDDFVSSLFIANTHSPVLFFSSRGIVYKLKVWRLPLGAPQARGKALPATVPIH